MAEDYHQKYYLSSYGTLVKELRAIYPEFSDYVNSTAAARINGYVGGNGSCEGLAAELDLLGLSQQSRDVLINMVCPDAKEFFSEPCPLPGIG